MDSWALLWASHSNSKQQMLRVSWESDSQSHIQFMFSPSEINSNIVVSTTLNMYYIGFGMKYLHYSTHCVEILHSRSGELLSYLPGCHDSCHRVTIPHRLPHGHNVRSDVIILKGPEMFTNSPEPSLSFISNAQATCFANRSVCTGEKGGGRGRVNFLFCFLVMW